MNAPALDPSGLTMRDRGMVIYGKGKKKLGCIVHLPSGLWAAWDLHRKLGEYPSAGEAETAVRSPPKGPPGGKPPKGKAWEIRS
jgi:hypothetical protein